MEKSQIQVFFNAGEPEKIKEYQIYLDLSTSISYVSLLDEDVMRSAVIDMEYLEPKLINDMPMFFDTNTGRTYLQNESMAKTSPMAYELVIFLLPPAFEGWGKVIFSVCPHLGGGGGGVPVPGLGEGGYPVPGLGRGVPHPRSRWGVQHLRSRWGVQHLRSGWWGVPPDQVWVVGDTPQPGLDGGGIWGIP